MLKIPTILDKEQIINYKNEMLENGDTLDGSSYLRAFSTVESWLEFINLLSSEATVPEGMVPADTFIAIRKEDNKLVGMLDFRHHINHPILNEYGGHIGYSVIPSERNKGYATMILEAMLKQCKHMGIQKILITCNSANLASEKVIIKNNRVFDRLSFDPESKNEVKRFLINLN